MNEWMIEPDECIPVRTTMMTEELLMTDIPGSCRQTRLSTVSRGCSPTLAWTLSRYTSNIFITATCISIMHEYHDFMSSTLLKNVNFCREPSTTCPSPLHFTGSLICRLGRGEQMIRYRGNGFLSMLKLTSFAVEIELLIVADEIRFSCNH